ncbi:MAG: alpha/beta fold hydrolase [Acidimicrobiales bacterium]
MMSLTRRSRIRRAGARAQGPDPYGWVVAGAVGVPALWSAVHRWSMIASDWSASKIEPRRFGRLWARSVGRSDDAVVLLHGLISTGDVFGAAYDRLAATHRLVVPDLLGFGRSMDEERTSFGGEDHLDALDELAERAGLFESSRWTLGAHSMGVSLALRWAARHPDRVVRVVGWGAPVYQSTERARALVTRSLMARLFALDTEMAARVCALSCRHRTAAGWLSVAAEPRLPVSIARATPLHTWPAYRDAVRHLVLDVDWETLVAACDRHAVEVGFVWGAKDRIGDRSYAERLVEGARRASVEVLDRGDHRLPLTHPATCIGQLTASRR